MSFFTSNSKKFFLALWLTVILFSLICAGVFFVTKTQTNGKSYIIKSASKAKHIELLFKHAKKPDIIFIGSSRTLFHIDSGEMQNFLHLKTYNYGLDGHTISSYPYIAQQAIKYHPQFIVINIDLAELYSAPENVRDVYLPDLYAYLKTHQNLHFLMTSIGNYFAQFNIIRQRSGDIHRFIVQHSGVFSHARGYDIEKNKNDSVKQYGACIPFLNENNVGAKLLVVHCQNGDGILFGMTEVLPQKTERLNGINQNTLDLLKYTIALIQKNHITPILVFSPSYSLHYVYDEKKLADVLTLDVIDLSNFNMARENWGNENHLNDAGRKLFTKVLAGEILKVVRTDYCLETAHCQF